MSSSEKAQELICEYMPDIRYGCPYGFMYEWDDVSDKWINRINNALFEYADGMHPSEVLAIIDLPFWENGKNPMKNGIAGAKKMVNEWITDAIRQ